MIAIPFAVFLIFIFFLAGGWAGAKFTDARSHFYKRRWQYSSDEAIGLAKENDSLTKINTQLIAERDELNGSLEVLEILYTASLENKSLKGLEDLLNFLK